MFSMRTIADRLRAFENYTALEPTNLEGFLERYKIKFDELFDLDEKKKFEYSKVLIADEYPTWDATFEDIRAFGKIRYLCPIESDHCSPVHMECDLMFQLFTFQDWDWSEIEPRYRPFIATVCAPEKFLLMDFKASFARDTFSPLLSCNSEYLEEILKHNKILHSHSLYTKIKDYLFSDYVEVVSSSGEVGDYLQACNTIPKGKCFTLYGGRGIHVGDIHNQSQVDAMVYLIDNTDRSVCIQIGDLVYLMVGFTNSEETCQSGALGSLAEHSCGAVNSEYKKIKLTIAGVDVHLIGLYATREIQEGEHIYIQYGPGIVRTHPYKNCIDILKMNKVITPALQEELYKEYLKFHSFRLVSTDFWVECKCSECKTIVHENSPIFTSWIFCKDTVDMEPFSDLCDMYCFTTGIQRDTIGKLRKLIEKRSSFHVFSTSPNEPPPSNDVVYVKLKSKAANKILEDQYESYLRDYHNKHELDYGIEFNRDAAGVVVPKVKTKYCRDPTVLDQYRFGVKALNDRGRPPEGPRAELYELLGIPNFSRKQPPEVLAKNVLGSKYKKAKKQIEKLTAEIREHNRTCEPSNRVQI